MRSAAASAYRAGEIGVGLATGQGQLVYVPQNQSTWSNGGGSAGTGGGIIDLLPDGTGLPSGPTGPVQGVGGRGSWACQ
ncbi:MAG: hypothetical protein KJ622_07485 [Alphaproteobacteria bacterium]|nr:hypothetical protein [Alphaproteobacteria bacterium]